MNYRIAMTPISVKNMKKWKDM